MWAGPTTDFIITFQEVSEPFFWFWELSRRFLNRFFRRFDFFFSVSFSLSLRFLFFLSFFIFVSISKNTHVS